MPSPPGRVVTHALQALTELDTESTITSIDGTSAYDTKSRKAMLESLAQVSGGIAVLPFVRVFHSSPSAYLWEDGTVHTIRQGEGREQGDASMPLLFCLGQHAALEAIQRELNPNEKLFAFLDDLHLVSKPDGVGAFMAAKTHVWNRAGSKPKACDVLQRVAEAEDPDARVWRGAEVPTEEQGISKILPFVIQKLHLAEMFSKVPTCSSASLMIRKFAENCSSLTRFDKFRCAR